MLTGSDGIPGHWIVLLCRISSGKGKLGPIRVDLRSSRTVSSGFLAGRAVLSAVFIVLIDIL